MSFTERCHEVLAVFPRVQRRSCITSISVQNLNPSKIWAKSLEYRWSTYFPSSVHLVKLIFPLGVGKVNFSSLRTLWSLTHSWTHCSVYFLHSAERGSKGGRVGVVHLVCGWSVEGRVQWGSWCLRWWLVAGTKTAGLPSGRRKPTKSPKKACPACWKRDCIPSTFL